MFLSNLISVFSTHGKLCFSFTYFSEISNHSVELNVLFLIFSIYVAVSDNELWTEKNLSSSKRASNGCSGLPQAYGHGLLPFCYVFHHKNCWLCSAVLDALPSCNWPKNYRLRVENWPFDKDFHSIEIWFLIEVEEDWLH